VRILGMSPSEVVALLLIGMGPVSITLAYMPLALALPQDKRSALAWRTVLVAFIVAVGVVLLGASIVNNFGLTVEILLIAAGAAYIILAIPVLLATPTDVAPPAQVTDPLRLALSPLAVPELITPAGLATLFAVAAFAEDALSRLVFLGLVLVILALDFGLMWLSARFAHRLTKPILEIIGKVMAFILLGFGVRLALEGLAGLHVITLRGL
jgi:multiple antibiotic resistance protein